MDAGPVPVGGVFVTPPGGPAKTRGGAHEVLFPRSIAVIGATDDVTKHGGRLVYLLRKHGFAGRLLPVNPRRAEVQGLVCYPSIGMVPRGDGGEAPDVAILAVPAPVVVDAVRECVEAGVRGCVIMTKWFADAGPEGAAQQETLAEIARRDGLRIVGPNCMGIINTAHSMALTSARVLDVERMIPGTIGFITQSGGLMASVYNRAHDAGLGFRYCVSTGNQVDLDICDFLEYMLEDSETRAVCLYVESLRDPARFFDLARACRRAGKPVLMVKAGRTVEGAEAARSHTAGLVGSFAAIEAACLDTGVLLTDDVDGMVEAAGFIARWGPPRGSGIGMLSPSGGGIAIMVDRLVDAGLRIASLTDTTRTRLVESMIPAQAHNPVDLGGCREADPATAAASMAALAADPNVAVVLVVLTTATVYEQKVEAMARAALATGTPVLVAVMPGSVSDQVRAILRSLGCPYTNRLDDALRVVRLWMRYGDEVCAPAGDLTDAGKAPAAAGSPSGESLPDGPLTEIEVKSLLAACGVAVNRGELARTPDEAVRIAERLGYPVALKAVRRGLIHKSDVGGVRLRLRDGPAVSVAFADIARRAANAGSDQLEGCLVQEMIDGELELLVGVRREPGLGAIVVAGAGGTLAELLHDTAVALAPVDRRHARALLRRLRIGRLLDGFRGRPPLDADAVVDVMCRMSALAVSLGERLVDLEVNPLIVRRDGQGAVAVDGRATLAPAAPAR
jgi:acyl-CoA synthetase (NDP forming)